MSWHNPMTKEDRERVQMALTGKTKKKPSNGRYKLVYMIGQKVIQTIDENKPYGLLAGIKKQVEALPKYKTGKLEII